MGVAVSLIIQPVKIWFVASDEDRVSNKLVKHSCTKCVKHIKYICVIFYRCLLWRHLDRVQVRAVSDGLQRRRHQIRMQDPEAKVWLKPLFPGRAVHWHGPGVPMRTLSFWIHRGRYPERMHPREEWLLHPALLPRGQMWGGCRPGALWTLPPRWVHIQQTQNICVTFIQCWYNVEEIGSTLYKCYTNVLCLLGSGRCTVSTARVRTV